MRIALTLKQVQLNTIHSSIRKQLIVPNTKLRHTIQMTNYRKVYIYFDEW